MHEQREGRVGGQPERRQRSNDDICEQNPGDASREREHETLGQQLAEQAHTSRADRESDGHFSRSGAGPGKQQARHVGARDGEHQRRQRQQQSGNDERRWRFLDAGPQLALRAEDTLAVRDREGSGKLAAEDIELGLCGGWIGTVTKTGSKGQVPRRAILERRDGCRTQAIGHRERHVDAMTHELVDAREGLGRHAHDDERQAVDANGRADNIRATSKVRPPRLVAQDDGRFASWDAGLAGRKPPSQHGLHAEHIEEAVAHEQAESQLRDGIVVPGHHEARRAEGDEALEGARRAAQVTEVGVRNLFGGTRSAPVRDGHDLGRPMDRHRPEEHGIREAEGRGVCADAEGEGEDGDQREPRVAHEQPKGVAHVLARAARATSYPTLRGSAP